MTQQPSHPAFEPVRSVPIEALQLSVTEYRHKATGARHYHLAADDEQNVFLVGFRTVPEDSTGIAHILEHTVLCGSQRFPVRDPFFMMIRRSLNTFMNAFTSSDWTAYPFASCNRKDFHNLLDIYLDAAFFSRLDPLDFAQEGHRLEFEQPDDPSSELVFKGVVFNEMKGAMSSANAVLWQELSAALFPDTTYHHNSGGEPEAIPDLTYDDLIAFYQRFYHPSNAVFMTYGDMPVEELQQAIEDKALAQFKECQSCAAVALQPAFSQPQVREASYALDEDETRNKTYINIGWLLPESSDLDARLEAQLLEGVLLENSASPLMHALETTDLGSAPSSVMGLEDSQRQMAFVVGVEGSAPEHAQAVEQLVLDTLERVAEQGVDQQMVESVMHQLELEQREVTGDGFPYGLQLIVQALPAAIHDSDPIALLDLEPALAGLREKVQNPEFIPQLVRRLLLENPHRVRMTLKPDTELSKQREQAEKARLAQIRESLDEDETGQIVHRAQALAERQAQEDDLSILPTVTREDIPPQRSWPKPAQEVHKPAHQIWYDRSTNGLSYVQVAIELPKLDEQEQQLLPILSSLITELGAGVRDYMAMAEAMAAKTGGIGAHNSIRAGIEDIHQISGYWVLSGKALTRNAEDLVALMHQYLNDARFDEVSRIRDLISQMRFGMEHGVAGRGHVHAMNLASSGMSARARMRHQAGGVAGVRYIKTLDASLDQADALTTLAERLQALHRKLKGNLRHYNIITEQKHFPELAAALTPHVAAGAPTDAFTLPEYQTQVQAGWLGNLAVNYVAKAYPAVAPKQEDAAALSVLGGFLRNGFLHTAIREKGGAYGGGAGYDPESGSFRFFSYRDPRLDETLADFDRAIDWLQSGDFSRREVDEAIFGVISGIDKPGSPAGEAKKAFFNHCHSRSEQDLQTMRARVLDVTADDLKAVAQRYLTPERASVGVLSGVDKREQLEALGLTIERI